MAHGDEESFVILDDVSARASQAGRCLGLLLSTIVGRQRRLSVTRGLCGGESWMRRAKARTESGLLSSVLRCALPIT